MRGIGVENECLKLIFIIRGLKYNFRPFNVGVIFDFLGSNGLVLGLGKCSNTVLVSTHVVEQLSFSMLP